MHRRPAPATAQADRNRPGPVPGHPGSRSLSLKHLEVRLPRAS